MLVRSAETTVSHFFYIGKRRFEISSCYLCISQRDESDGVANFWRQGEIINAGRICYVWF